MALDEPGIKTTVEAYKGGAVCVRCGHQGEPLEPYFDLMLAAELIPMTYGSLKGYLCKNRQDFPARYRLQRGNRKVRLLSASEIKRIRSRILRGPGKPV